MNDFKNGSFETVSDEELSQVSGGEANIGVDPCGLSIIPLSWGGLEW